MKHTGYIHPNYLGWQVDWPVFVKIPFSSFGKYWKKGEEFNWSVQIGADASKIAHLYASGYIYHNRDLEKSTKVGDRLSEMDSEQLLKLVKLVNVEIKQRTTTEKNTTTSALSSPRLTTNNVDLFVLGCTEMNGCVMITTAFEILSLKND